LKELFLTTHPVDEVGPGTGRLFVIWALSILVAAAFFMAGGAKLASAPAMVAEFATIGVGQWFRYVTGALEVLGAIGLLIPRLGRYAAVLLCVITIGATIACLTVLRTNPTAAIMLLMLSALIAFLRSR
jgi:putative oxidoreductase